MVHPPSSPRGDTGLTFSGVQGDVACGMPASNVTTEVSTAVLCVNLGFKRATCLGGGGGGYMGFVFTQQS
jgi:hypothetical protein